MRSDRIRDQSIAGAIDVNHVARQEAIHTPAARGLERRDEINAGDAGFLGDLPSCRLIGESPSRLMQQLSLIGPNDEDHFAVVLPALVDHCVQVVGEVVEADSRSPVRIRIEVIPGRLFGPAGFVLRLLVSS